jgi:hypothetical protein
VDVKVGVLGTGTVGRTIAGALVARGHEVCMGARTADNSNASAWASAAGERASHGTFADAAAFGDVVFNCTSGAHSVEVLRAAGGALDGKVLIDVANPLDFSNGMPPTLLVGNTDSLAEALQREFPNVRVVKSLNTVNASVMVDPSRVPGEHDMFVSGNDAAAKAAVTAVLKDVFGWRSVIDLGDIRAARSQEAWVPMWVRLYGVLGTADFNIRLVRGGGR